MYPGDRHPTRACARCHLYRSPVCHSPPFIHAVVIRSCGVPQLCDAESSGCSRGCRKVGHAHRGG
eukprot:6715885-Prymnesium_polylepis.1